MILKRDLEIVDVKKIVSVIKQVTAVQFVAKRNAV